MPRRKQICPKRMKYDGKGGEVEDQGPDEQDATLGSTDSEEDSPDPDSPQSAAGHISDTEQTLDENNEKSRTSTKMEDNKEQDVTISNSGTASKKSEELIKHAIMMDAMPLSLMESTKSDEMEHIPSTGNGACSENTAIDQKSSQMKPELDVSSKEVESVKSDHSLSGSPPCLIPEKSTGDLKGSNSPPRLHPVLKSHVMEHSELNKVRSSLNMLSPREKGRSKDSVSHKLYSERRMHNNHEHHGNRDREQRDREKKVHQHRDREHRDRENRDREHRDHDREHRRDRDHHRNRDHRRDSYSPSFSRSDSDYKSHQSLAKKYADLFSSPTSCKSDSRKAAVKLERLSSPASTSYEPLRGIADMVKAAERRSPTTPQSAYHSRFNYMKSLSTSPSSLEALQRVVEKDRMSSDKRPSAMQSMNNTYNKYLPLPPTPRNTQSTPPQASPDLDPDKPLDLSVRSKKDISGLPKHRKDSSPQPYLSSEAELLQSSSTSTLASLEKTFGDDSFMFDRIGSKHFNTPIRQFYMSAFGMGIYSTALNNSYPFPPSHAALMLPASQSQILQPSNNKVHLSQNESLMKKPQSSFTTTPPCSEDSSKSYIPSKFLEQAMKDPNIDLKKHTNLQCSCGAEFGTLYQLTLHLQETGHPAGKIKNGTHHDYPKLVRGQDMWLNHGSEQTKQILRCMQCGESFKSLPELTVHMIQTKHYTNIVGADTQGKVVKPGKSMSMSDCSDSEFSVPQKCSECMERFEDRDSLIQHQEKTGHLNLKCEPDLLKLEFTPPRPTSALSDKDTTGSRTTLSSSSNGSIMHFKRRLLESLNDKPDVPDEDSHESSFSSHSIHESSRIWCENCNEQIQTENFVKHVRQCVKNIRSPRRSRSRSHSPVEKKYKDYLNGEFHMKKEKCDQDMRSPIKELGMRDYGGDRFRYYQEFMYQHEEREHEISRHVKESCSEPDSSQSTAQDYSMTTAVHSSTELVKPPEDSTDTDGASALKAMESFIERSFTHKTARRPVQSSSLFASSLFARNFFSAHPQLPPIPPERPQQVDRLSPVTRQETQSPQKNSSHLYQNKYLPPSFCEIPSSQMSAGNNQIDTQPQSPVCTSPNIKKEFKSPQPKENGEIPNMIQTPDKNDNTDIDQHNPSRKRSYDQDGDELYKPLQKIQKNILQEKYLQENPTKDVDGVGEGTEKENEVVESKEKPSSGSALQSLQGLVYGKSFNTEHPLDSLQKLIHTTNSTSSSQTTTTSHAVLSPSLVSSKGTSLPTTLPGTVILVNPIVTVLTNSKDGSPSLQISLPTPGPGSPDYKDLHSPHSDSPSRDNKSPTPDGDGDQNSEYRCIACNRNFASKGSYRYHLSRCHWSTVKKYRIKEAINTSPYVYLPLDHTAKFNKYYEMANELANKGK